MARGAGGTDARGIGPQHRGRSRVHRGRHGPPTDRARAPSPGGAPTGGHHDALRPKLEAAGSSGVVKAATTAGGSTGASMRVPVAFSRCLLLWLSSKPALSSDSRSARRTVHP
jgi:hypothetical protein